MTTNEKISNVYLAFKFSILDHSYSKLEIKEIINNNVALLEALNGIVLRDEELDNTVSIYSIEGNFIESNKILMELLRKKFINKSPGYIQVLKTLDTMTWVGGLEDQKVNEIQEIISIHEEVDNHMLSNTLMKRIGECIKGYEDYDIAVYLKNP